MRKLHFVVHDGFSSLDFLCCFCFLCFDYVSFQIFVHLFTVELTFILTKPNSDALASNTGMIVVNLSHWFDEHLELCEKKTLDHRELFVKITKFR